MGIFNVPVSDRIDPSKYHVNILDKGDKDNQEVGLVIKTANPSDPFIAVRGLVQRFRENNIPIRVDPASAAISVPSGYYILVGRKP